MSVPMAFRRLGLWFFVLGCAIDGMALSLQRSSSLQPGGLKRPMKIVQYAVSRMLACPNSTDEQLWYCGFLREQAMGVSDATRQALVEDGGVLPVLADAMEHHMTNKSIFMTCTAAMELTVVFHRNNTLRMNETTHALDTLVKGLRMYSHDKEVNRNCLHSLSGFASVVVPELTLRVQELGGFDVIWDALEYFNSSSDGLELMSAMQGLSNLAHTKSGAAIIANHGGQNEGIKYLTKLLRDQAPYTAHQGAETLVYEIMQVANLMLQSEKKLGESNIYREAFTQAGFLKEVFKSMKSEADIRTTNDVGCQIIDLLTEANVGNQNLLVDYGGIQVLVNTINKFQDPDNTTWPGSTLGDACPVIPHCVRILTTLAHNSTDNREAMQKLGMEKVLAIS